MNMEMVLAYRRDIRKQIDTLSAVLWRLRCQTSNLHIAWKGNDAAIVRTELEETIYHIYRLIKDMQELERDLLLECQYIEEQQSAEMRE